MIGCGQTAYSYSVITHLAVIDSSWDSTIAPAIQERFAGATEAEVKAARKFAYGGCLIQDLGYYPGGNKLFSDLLHYVRSGDFVVALIEESESPADYAFALGALSHHASDNNGHASATNLSVPILYPDLRKKFGDIVTFDEKPSAHIKVCEGTGKAKRSTQATVGVVGRLKINRLSYCFIDSFQGFHKIQFAAPEWKMPEPLQYRRFY